MKKGRLIGQGRTAEIFEWDGNKILKLFRGGIPESFIENEFRIGLELYKKGLPVPEVDSLIELDERIGIVYERINGPTMISLVSSKPWKTPYEAQRMAELHKAIQVPIDAKITPTKSRLKESINESRLLSDKLKEYVLEVLLSLPDGNILCHGDFHPDNIIVSKDKVVVIDWMTATVGNPLSDIARTSVIFKFGVLPEHKSKIEAGIINFVRGKFLSEYIKHYLKITEVSREGFEQWEVPHAAARLTERISPKEKEQLLGFVAAHIA